MSRLLDNLCEAFVAKAEAAEALERCPPGMTLPNAVYWTPVGRTVVRGGDIRARAVARRERAQADLERAFDAVIEAVGEYLDASLLDALFDTARDEAEASRAVRAMEDYAQEYECSVSNESYRRAQEDQARAIRAREEAQVDILVHVDERAQQAPRHPAPTPGPARPRTPRRSARSRAAADPGTTTATADSEPPAPGDAPPPRVSPTALLTALRGADPATLAAIRDALGDVPRPRFVPSESQRALWSYLLATPVARSLDLLALDLRRAKRTVLRDVRVLEERGIVRRVEGGGLLVLPLDGNQRGTTGELTGAPSSGSVVSP